MAAGGEGGCVPCVLVTGASGYVASHVIRQLLEAGYRVRGSVRDLKNASKVDFLRKLPFSERLELVELRLESDDGWEGVCDGVEYVIHAASPVGVSMTEEDVPVAVDGTMRVVKSAIAGKVKRMVCTSSIVAIAWGNDVRKEEFGPEDWTDQENCAKPYEKSKTLAEKAAWDALSGDGMPEMVTIHPSACLGPSVSFDAPAPVSSQQLVHGLVCGHFLGIPDFRMPYVDVRDVARAHILAMTVPEAAGKRFILSEKGTYDITHLASTLSTTFPHLNTPSIPLPTFLVWIASFFDINAAYFYPELGRTTKFDTRATEEILGLKVRHPAKSAIETVHYLITTKRIPDSPSHPSIPAIKPGWVVAVENVSEISLN